MGKKLLSPSTDCSRLSGNASQPVAICCMTKLFLGRHNTHVHSSQIGKPCQTKYGHHQSPTWWTIEFYWGSLQKQKWQLHYHGPPSTGDHWQKLRTWSTLCNLQAAQGIEESSFPSESLPGSWSDFNLCRLACLRISCTAQLLLFTMGGRGLVNLVSFKDFLELFWVVCLFV